MVQCWSFEKLHEQAGRSIHTKAAHNIWVRERQQNLGLTVRLSSRFEYLTSHWTPRFLVPDEVDRLFAAIINNTEDRQVCTEPRAYFNSG